MPNAPATPPIDAWLIATAWPFASKAMAVGGDKGWFVADATTRADGRVLHATIYGSDEAEWSLADAPHSAHERLALAALSPSFWEGWASLADTLAARTPLSFARFLAEHHDGGPLLRLIAKTQSGHTLHTILLDKRGPTAALDGFLRHMDDLATA